MTLRQKQSEFDRLFPILVIYIYSRGFEITSGDAWAHDGHIKGSFHYLRLAKDINLFKNGRLLKTTKSHLIFGEFWESLDPMCSWGGRWEDGGHYSWGEGKR